MSKRFNIYYSGQSEERIDCLETIRQIEHPEDSTFISVRNLPQGRRNCEKDAEANGIVDYTKFAPLFIGHINDCFNINNTKELLPGMLWINNQNGTNFIVNSDSEVILKTTENVFIVEYFGYSLIATTRDTLAKDDRQENYYTLNGKYILTHETKFELSDIENECIISILKAEQETTKQKKLV